MTYEDESLESAAKLSSEHLRESKLPDKAIDVIDESGAAAKLAGIEVVTVAHMEETIARMAKIPPKSVSTESPQVDQAPKSAVLISLAASAEGPGPAIHRVEEGILAPSPATIS